MVWFSSYDSMERSAFFRYGIRFRIGTTLRTCIAVVFVLAAPDFATAAPPVTAALDDFALSVWETDEELPNNDVLSLLPDRSGFLWVGTASGLVRFDGRAFIKPHNSGQTVFRASTVYSLAEGQRGEFLFVHDLDASNRLMSWKSGVVREHPASAALLPGRKARSVYKEPGGVVWILCIDREWIRWTPAGVEYFPPETPISQYEPHGMAVSENGRVFLSRGAGVEVYQNGLLHPLDGIGKGPAVLASSTVGGVWIAEGGQLFHWHDDILESREPPLPPAGSWPPYLMMEARDGALWMAFRDSGLFRSTAAGISEVPTSHRMLRCLAEDREENIWVGTAGGGLNRIHRSNVALWATEASDTIGSICEDARGTLWLGNARGIWKLIDGEAVIAGNSPEWPQFAHALSPDRDGALWIGGSRQVFRYRPGLDEHPLPMPPAEVDHAYALFCDRDGAVWAGCESGPLLRYGKHGELEKFGPEQGYTGTFAQVFGEDATGGLWVGTRLGELFQFTGGAFVKRDNPLSALGTGVLTINPGASGALWFGTRGLGFLRLKNGAFQLVGPEQGLPDGVIAQTLVDDDRNFWVGSSNSIFMVAEEELDACADGRSLSVRLIRFGRSDGITGFFATGQRQPCAWQGRDGRMWFVGRKGVVAIHPSQRNAIPVIPGIFIDQTTTDNGILSPGESFPSSNRRIEFRFTSPTFIAPDDMRFRYRLLDFDKQWTESGGQRMAVFSRLPPGDYTFEVSSSNRRKIWNPAPARFKFTVSPMWWELWWVRGFALACVAAAAVWLVRHWSNRRLRRKTATLEQQRKVGVERERIARDLHDGIGSGLTQAGWLVAEIKDEAVESQTIRDQADALGTRIRELARSLDAAVWAVSPRHDMLGSLCAYLCEFALEHFRLTPIRCRVEVPDRLPEGPLAPHLRNHLLMATRESLNNVLKHSAATEVRLKVTCDRDMLEIEISDNGCGFALDAVADSSRHGLANLKARMNEVSGRAEVTSGTTGTCVRLIVPITG